MRAEYPSLASPPLSPRIQGLLCDLFGWGQAAAGIAQGIATTAAAKMQADAARDAAKLAADAATHGADLQDAAAQRTEAFNREQADYAAQQQEVDRHANYEQYAAGRRYQGSLSQMLGLGGMSVPAYVPGVVPHFTTAPAPGGPSAPGAPPAMTPPPPAGPAGPAAMPANFGAALAPGASAAAAAMAPGAPPSPTAPPGVPQLQPDGTYAMVSSMPRYPSFGQYLEA
jgi:hypothetical protein